MYSNSQITADSSLSPIIEKLESLFSKFNERFFRNELQKPVIAVSPNRRRGAYLGWCTLWKAWRTGYDQPNDEPKVKTGGYYEINMCAEYLARPLEETCSTLLHEMVHLHNLQLGIQDVSRSGLYHNKRFKTAAESHGLIVRKSERYGFCRTTLNDDAADFVASLNEDTFNLYRDVFSKTSVPKSSSAKRYVCPGGCGLIIRATRDVRVLCIECGAELIKSC